jgi:arsenite methyltransferase
MPQLAFDEQTGRRLEEIYRTRDVLRRRRLVHEALGAAPGERVLDVGCGPGFFVAELLDRVGPEGAVAGTDRSPEMLAAAARRCARRANVEFHRADATALPVAGGAFDRALCVQVLEYLPDPDAALAELHRALRPGGRLVVWDIDWATVSWHSDDPERMERVLRAWDRHLAHPSLPRTFAPRLRAAGFVDVALEGHAFASAEFSADAFGVAAMSLIEPFVAGQADVGAAEAAAWAAEQRALGERGEFFFACVQFCATATRR